MEGCAYISLSFLTGINIFKEETPIRNGFRPKRSCHTALQYIKRNYTGVKWFVEGDIKGCFDHVDHHVLVQILRRRIADVRKLKDLSGKAEWERQMIARKRKTIALCHSCHVKLHNGKLD